MAGTKSDLYPEDSSDYRIFTKSVVGMNFKKETSFGKVLALHMPLMQKTVTDIAASKPVSAPVKKKSVLVALSIKKPAIADDYAPILTGTPAVQNRKRPGETESEVSKRSRVERVFAPQEAQEIPEDLEDFFYDFLAEGAAGDGSNLDDLKAESDIDLFSELYPTPISEALVLEAPRTHVPKTNAESTYHDESQEEMPATVAISTMGERTFIPISEPETHDFIAKDYTSILYRSRFTLHHEKGDNIGLKAMRLCFELDDSDVERYELKKWVEIVVRIPETQILDESYKDHTRERVLYFTQRLGNPERLGLIPYLNSDRFISAFCLKILPDCGITINQEHLGIHFGTEESRQSLDFSLDCLKAIELDENKKHRLISKLYQYLSHKNLKDALELKQDEEMQAELNAAVKHLLSLKGALQSIRMVSTRVPFCAERQTFLCEEEEPNEEEELEDEEEEYTQYLRECTLSIKHNKSVASHFLFDADWVMPLRIKFIPLKDSRLQWEKFSVRGLVGPATTNRIDNLYRHYIRQTLVQVSIQVKNDETRFVNYLKNPFFQQAFNAKVLKHCKTKPLGENTAVVFAPGSSYYKGLGSDKTLDSDEVDLNP